MVGKRKNGRKDRRGARVRMNAPHGRRIPPPRNAAVWCLNTIPPTLGEPVSSSVLRLSATCSRSGRAARGSGSTRRRQPIPLFTGGIPSGIRDSAPQSSVCPRSYSCKRRIESVAARKSAASNRTGRPPVAPFPSFPLLASLSPCHRPRPARPISRGTLDAVINLCVALFR
jgi:hypothetical protein